MQIVSRNNERVVRALRLLRVRSFLQQPARGPRDNNEAGLDFLPGWKIPASRSLPRRGIFGKRTRNYIRTNSPEGRRTQGTLRLN
jgi:hypothetical protein